MKRATKIILVLVVLVAVAGGAAVAFSSSGNDGEDALPTVEVTRGDIVDKALAVGTIEPRVEVDVKSQVSGVVRRQFAEAGDYVEAGSPLLEIKPNPTPRELVDAERQIDLRQLEVDNLGDEFERLEQLREKQLVSEQEFERAKRGYEEAKLQVQIAREQLALLREGRVSTNTGDFETVVRAPVSGFILDKEVEIGDPVVPLTSFQEGTVLMTMANMDDLIFRGTVDEIDVGRLTEGMAATIQVGALPNANVAGRVEKIWLKAQQEEGSTSTVFPVELEITEAVQVDSSAEVPQRPVTLRAGYSANAEIIIERRDSVLLIPERVVEFTEDDATVQVALAEGESETRPIQTGLSDAINIEVVSGLEEGTPLREKPPKEIE